MKLLVVVPMNDVEQEFGGIEERDVQSFVAFEQQQSVERVVRGRMKETMNVLVQVLVELLLNKHTRRKSNGSCS